MASSFYCLILVHLSDAHTIDRAGNVIGQLRRKGMLSSNNNIHNKEKAMVLIGSLTLWWCQLRVILVVSPRK